MLDSQNRISRGKALHSLWFIAIVCTLCLGQTAHKEPQWLSPERGSRDLNPAEASTNSLLSEGQFFHVPGPNPIIVRGGKDAWDEKKIESCDIIEDFGTYYYYYHAQPLNGQRWNPPDWRIGIATAPHPFGPWTKYSGNPVLVQGPKGSWDDGAVFSATVLKRGTDQYYLFYGGFAAGHHCCDIGFATASSPLGPWKKHSGNPVLRDFGYPGSIIFHNGKFYLYAEYPIGSTAPDYGPIALATAEKPEGPWTKWEGNPVLKAGDWGSWDDGGFSESKVTFWEGVFHLFYGGAKRYEPRMLTRESVGYAYSFDGYHFIKYARNPVARRESNPNAAAFAEVHSLFEPPFIYLFHTLRYVTSQNPRFPQVEDLGVEALALRRPFRVSMPLFMLTALPGGGTSSLDICPPIGLGEASRVALTVQCEYAASAQSALRVHVKSSYDGVHFDTSDVQTFDVDLQAGQTCQKTVSVSSPAKFLKVVVENPDSTNNVSTVVVTATITG
jgi:hypothetical protein